MSSNQPLIHPPVNMPETRRYRLLELLRVDGPYVVGYLATEKEDGTPTTCLGTRWVDLTTHKVFPQSRGYATWKELPDKDEVPYLKHLLDVTGTDNKAVLRLLDQLMP